MSAAVASQCFHDTLDNLVKLALHLLSRRCVYATEFWGAILDMIHPIDISQ
ncbi:MAG: hypothetical protein H0X02_01235 [Nitrosomonas sp.]|nr:hypothetical protein [Nitrosomonas sp.]